jgi:hypothetical protein
MSEFHVFFGGLPQESPTNPESSHPSTPSHSSHPSRSLVIAVDFDGVIVEDAYPGIGAPIWPVVEKLRLALERGDRLILNTCRCGERLQEALAACEAMSLTFAAVNENLPERIAFYGGDSRKISADVYWDDKAFNPRCDIP